MKRSFGLMLAVLMFPALAAGQTSRVYTRPAPLSRDALDRLHLKQAWRALIPVGAPRAGIYSVQFTDAEILVQTRAGLVAAVSPTDGTTLWSKQVGLPFRVTHGAGWNAQTIYVTRGTFLYAIDRKTGKERWQYDMPG